MKLLCGSNKTRILLSDHSHHFAAANRGKLAEIVSRFHAEATRSLCYQYRLQSLITQLFDAYRWRYFLPERCNTTAISFTVRGVRICKKFLSTPLSAVVEVTGARGGSAQLRFHPHPAGRWATLLNYCDEKTKQQYCIILQSQLALYKNAQNAKFCVSFPKLGTAHAGSSKRSPQLLCWDS